MRPSFRSLHETWTEANSQFWFTPHDMHLTLPLPIHRRVDKFHVVFPEKLSKDQIDFHEGKAIGKLSHFVINSSCTVKRLTFDQGILLGLARMAAMPL